MPHTYRNILYDGKVQDFEPVGYDGKNMIYKSKLGYVVRESTLDTLLREQQSGKIGEGQAFYDLRKIAVLGGRGE